MDLMQWLEENRKPEFMIARGNAAEMKNAFASADSESAGDNVVQWVKTNARPEFTLVPLSQTQNVPRENPAGAADAGADSDDDLWDAPLSEHFRGAEKLLRPAHEYADALDAQVDKGENAVNEWFDRNPNAARIAGATLAKSVLDLARSEADLLRFGEGMAEGGVGGVAEDALRGIGLVSHMAGPALMLRQPAGRAVIARRGPGGRLPSPGGGNMPRASLRAPSSMGQGNEALLERIKDIPWEYGDTGRHAGKTDKYGNILINWALKAKDRIKDRVETVLHESVHRKLSPKSGPFLEARADFGENAYHQSDLVRYIEEALAETYGTGNLRKGLVYPFKEAEVDPFGLGTEAIAYLTTVGGGMYSGYKLAEGE